MNTYEFSCRHISNTNYVLHRTYTYMQPSTHRITSSHTKTQLVKEGYRSTSMLGNR